jgi:hypothetical protein
MAARICMLSAVLAAACGHSRQPLHHEDVALRCLDHCHQAFRHQSADPAYAQCQIRCSAPLCEARGFRDCGPDAGACTVRKREDFAACDGRAASVSGTYRAVGAPHAKGPPAAAADRAVIALDDGAEVFVEALNAPASRRAEAERARFAGHRVRVAGTFYKVMPDDGLASPLAPSVSGVSLIEETP